MLESSKVPRIGNPPNSTGNDGMDGTTAGQINALTAKATVVDADVTLIEDSAASYAKKKATFTVIKEWIQDWLASFLVAGTNMTLTYNDGSNTLTFDSTGGAGYTDEMAQDAIGAMIDTTIVYVDGTPLLTRAALTGAITASQGSNATSLGSFTKAQLDAAVSDGDVSYEGANVTSLDAQQGVQTLGGILNGLTSKTMPADADMTVLMDSAASNASKKLSWANLKVAIASYMASVTQTMTNKRIDPRVQSVTSSATVTPNADSDDSVVITAQAAGLTIANPSGTPVQSQPMLIRLKDNGTARAITWGSQYRGIGAALPSTTIISKTFYFSIVYNSTDTKWDVVYNVEP
jgi:hypothetical protein